MSELIELNQGCELINNIPKVETEMLKHEQVDCPVIHSFSPGIYIREVRIPADTFAIGHHQNFEHLNIFLKGKVSVLNDNGTVSILKAPMMFTGKPGRKIGYIHEEMVWLNVYPTTEQNIEKLENYYLTKSDEWLANLEIRAKLEKLQVSIDNQSFKEFVHEIGLTEEIVRQQSENTNDLAELPSGSYKIKTASSKIEGIGLFATADIEPGELIAPARIGINRTIAGRFTNHSCNPNAEMKLSANGDINLVSTKSIKGCKGGYNGEEITIDYRISLAVNLLSRKGAECQV